MRFRTERDTAVGSKAKAKCVIELNVDEIEAITAAVDQAVNTDVDLDAAADLGSLSIDLHGAQAAATKLESELRYAKGLGR